LKVETIHFDKIGDLQFTVYRQKQIIIFFPIEKNNNNGLETNETCITPDIKLFCVIRLRTVLF